MFESELLYKTGYKFLVIPPLTEASHLLLIYGPAFFNSYILQNKDLTLKYIILRSIHQRMVISYYLFSAINIMAD